MVNLAERLQFLMHQVGLEEFKKSLIAATENARNDTEDLENKEISEGYNQFLFELKEEKE